MSESDATPNPTPEQPTEPTTSATTPNGGQAAAALKGAHKLDLATIGAGGVVLLASLMPFYTVSVEAFGVSNSNSANAWHGFFGWFGAVCALGAAVVLILKIVGIALPVPVRLSVLGLFAVATICLLLALFVMPGGSCAPVCDMIDRGHGFGYWLALLAAIAGTALSAMRRGED